MISKSKIDSRLSYCSKTGLFTWLDIPETNRFAKTFNSTFSGKVAGCSMKDTGYITIRICNSLHLAHRLAWIVTHGSIDDSMDIDHQNGIKSDNRIENLRLVTRKVNAKNASRSKSNSTGITGVHIRRDTGKYSSEIMVDYKKISLGCFDNIFDAACARKSAERMYGFHINHGR